MKTLDYFLNLPYTVVLRPDEEGDVVGRIEELPGCAAHGKTREEALENLDEAKELWITDCLEAGNVVPEPVAEETLPSGKWLQRVPKTLHRRLIHAARKEAVSLNQFVTSVLAEAVGRRTSTETAQPSARMLLDTTLYQWLIRAWEERVRSSDWKVRQYPHPIGRPKRVSHVADWLIGGQTAGSLTKKTGREHLEDAN